MAVRDPPHPERAATAYARPSIRLPISMRQEMTHNFPLEGPPRNPDNLSGGLSHGKE
jgi:hypothetical protein